MAIKSNATGSVYLVAVLLNPTEAERIEGAKKTLVVPPQFIVAPDAEGATAAAVRLVPREFDTDRCEVLAALPFGK